MPLLPVAMFGLEVAPSGIPIPADIEFPATIRITMAAIDPDESIKTDGSKPRATLRIIRQKADEEDSEDDSEAEESMRALLADSDSDEEDESDAEDTKQGSKSKKADREATLKKLVDSMTSKDGDVEMTNGTNGTKDVKKGKKDATEVSDEEDEEDDSEGDDDEEDVEVEEFVLCTLDPEKTYQQPLDITIGENEQVYFSASGTHKVYLTGNYVLPDDDAQNRRLAYDSDEDEDYDLSPDEDELELDGSESDELDDLDNPRILEIDSDSEIKDIYTGDSDGSDAEEKVPKLVGNAAKNEKKGKNKRGAEDMSTGSLDAIISKSLTSGTAEAEPKLSKKQLKKLKKNDGEAAPAKVDDSKTDSAKKVQFAKNLEQGPTGSAEKPAKIDLKAKAETKTEAKPAAATAVNGKVALGMKTVNGVKIDDKKLGTGPTAKKGDRVGMRYIGKLDDGKVFDSNKKGKPFSFKLGAGEVIKGWDIGVMGMSVGSERRLIVPASLAYGSKGLPGIPANSTLTFDIKMLEIK